MRAWSICLPFYTVNDAIKRPFDIAMMSHPDQFYIVCIGKPGQITSILCQNF
jgi:hypothetical protein